MKSELKTPGQVLENDFMKPNAVKRTILAKAIGISSKKLNEIIKGKRAISAKAAASLAKYFKNKPEFWLDLQHEYDVKVANEVLKGVIPNFEEIEKYLVNNPHDKLIKIVLSERTEAISFLEKNLPKRLIKELDWETLMLKGTSFIDDELKGSESDLLYTVQFKDSGKECLLHILLEHQSRPDKYIRFRSLQYELRIWVDFLKQKPKPDPLPPIISVVLYIGKDKWNYSNQFSDLIEDTPLEPKYIPSFEHLMLDYSGKDKKIKGAIKTQIAHLLLQAHFYQNFKDIFNQLLELLHILQPISGVDYKKVFIVYMAATQKKEDVKEFLYEIKTKTTTNFIEGGDHMLCAIDAWKLEGKLEGELKGELKGKINVIENFLKAGVGWNLILNATGIDQDKFVGMKNEYKNLLSTSTSLIAQQSEKTAQYAESRV